MRQWRHLVRLKLPDHIVIGLLQDRQILETERTEVTTSRRGRRILMSYRYRYRWRGHGGTNDRTSLR